MALVVMEKRKQDDGSGLINMMVISFLIHALVISIVIFSPSWPSPRWTFGPVYTVDLVTLPVNKVETAGPVSALSRDLAGISPKEQPLVIRKAVEPTTIIPPKTMEVQKKTSSGATEKAIEDIRRKESASLPQTASAGRPGPILSRGDTALSMKMQVYYTVIWSKIREQWALPQGILDDDTIVAVVDLKILRNGEIADLTLEKRSGNTYFDESAVKAVRKAAPFPPLPEWLDQSVFEVGIRFHSSELR
ncbi:MAG: TonB family protein [Deltaproteobacteria bacterium]|nr:TonB family protein [Deltaproteobacteria bacterium]